MGKILHGKLDALGLSKVREIRGMGLMIGLELKERVKPYILQLMESGVLALPAGKRVLRLLPPLTIDDEQVEFLVNILYRLLR